MKAKRFIPGLLALAVAFPAAHAWAADNQDESAQAEAAIRAAVKGVVPDAKVDRIAPSAIPGMYEVSFGAQVYYITKDGRYMLAGDLLDLKTQENLTEKTQAQGRIGMLKKLDPKSMIVYPAKGERKHTVTVFTDIDCPYCRKLHAEMPKYNELGIEVRYMAFPRAGEKSHSFEKAVSVWCADDPRAAMDAAKRGEEPAPKNCPGNPVDKDYKLGIALGVTGTPALLLEDGRLLPGYLPAEKLLEVLEKKVAVR